MRWADRYWRRGRRGGVCVIKRKDAKAQRRKEEVKGKGVSGGVRDLFG